MNFVSFIIEDSDVEANLARHSALRWGFYVMGIEFVRRFIHPSQAKTGSLWSRRQTPIRCTSKPDPTNMHQVEGWWEAFTGVETRLWPTIDHLDPPDLPRHGCNSDRGPAASGGPTVLANDRNGGRLRLNASRHDDDDDQGYGVSHYSVTLFLPSVKYTRTSLWRASNLSFGSPSALV